MGKLSAASFLPVMVNWIRTSANMKLLRALTVAALAVQAAALSIGGKQMSVERDSDGLQNIVCSPKFLVEPVAVSIHHLRMVYHVQS